MASYIVEIENTSNSTRVRPFEWVIVEANSDAEANAKTNQGLGANERAGLTLPNSDEGFRRLRVSSPPFAATYGPGGYVSFVENTLGDLDGQLCIDNLTQIIYTISKLQLCEVVHHAIN